MTRHHIETIQKGIDMSATTTKPRTVHEAAAELGLSVHTIRAWIARRKIGSIRLGRAVRIPASEIARLVEQGTTPPLDERPRGVL
jgi:excisionase family DNA binding protein